MNSSYNNILKYSSSILLCALNINVKAQVDEKPNIVIILTDDQGYADISYNPLHPDQVYTPNMDSLAREGNFFTNAYITGNVSSPTRAGLMTGRYQQRATIYNAGEGGSGLPLDETTFPQLLKPSGYVSGAFGKWHLGLTLDYNPINRGFDEFYGFMGRGAHDYFALDDPESPLFRGLETIQDEGYLTNRLTEEAISFIKTNKEQPFFLYLAYNAVHSPAQAPEELIELYNTGDPLRDTLMAMLNLLDKGIGDVVKTLKEEGEWENTLLFFLTDNGGAGAMHAINTPLRNFKGTNYEGGIRTPFVVSWPAKFEGGKTVDTPVMSLDLLATALDAAGIQEPTEKPLDGKSILPILSGETDKTHENLFWSEGGETGEWAVRSGDWKLVTIKDNMELFNLADDIGETTDLSETYPDTLSRLINLYIDWISQMPKPMDQNSNLWSPAPPAGSAVSLYDQVFFGGNSQILSNIGIYNKSDLTTIGDNNVSSVLISDGYDAIAFSSDSLNGEKLIMENDFHFLQDFENQLSSILVYEEGDTEMRGLNISASMVENTAPYAMDNDFDTYWEGLGDNAWIQFEFCKEMPVDEIKIAFKRGQLRVAYFNIEASMDGISWTPVLIGGESSGLTKDFETFDLPDIKAKYVRIIGFGNSDNNQNHYVEVEFIFGSPPANYLLIEAEDYISGDLINKFIADDCTSILAIDITDNSAWTEYDFFTELTGLYNMNLRIKALQNASIELFLDDTKLKTISIDPLKIGTDWTSLSEKINLTKGDHKIDFRFSSSLTGSMLYFNWLEFIFESEILSTQKFNPNNIQLFPNPFNDIFTISSDLQVKEISVLDLSGRVIFTENYDSKYCHIEATKLPPGTYIIRINIDNNYYHLKSIKIK